MTVPATSRRAGPFSGNGVTTSFPFTFKLFSDEDLTVVVTDANAVESTLVLDSDYSVFINADQDATPGGVITYPVSGSPLAASRTLTAVGAEPYSQELDLPSGGGFSPRALENALDRIVFQVQQLAERLGRSMTLPASAAAADTELPVPAANAIIGWNAAGSALVNYEALPVGSALATNVSYTPAGSNAVATTAQAKLRESVSVFDFMTTAEIVACQAYSYVTDVTLPLQRAINHAWENGVKLFFPPGGYAVTGLSISETGAQAGRVLWMEGGGIGNPFTSGSANGTQIKCTINNPAFAVYTSAPSTSTGTLKIRGISFISNCTTAVVFLKGFYGTSEFGHNVVYQEGVGNGLETQAGATGLIHNSYFLNRDCVTYGMGAARVGVGVWINQQYDAGLTTINKCSSRGFRTPYKIGADSGTQYAYAASIENSECSVSYNGIHLTPFARATRVVNVYMEVGEGGIGVHDEGDYNVVKSCFTFSGFGTHLKSTAFTYGNVYESNTFAAGTLPNQVLIDVTSSSVDGGPGKTVSNNHLSFGGSGGTIAGVVGLRINGSDPRINLIGNSFLPRGPWVGGAGTLKVNDLSASSDTTVGSGVYGVKLGRSIAQALEVPTLGRGAINLAVEPTALNNTNIAAGVLTLGEMSVFTLTPTGSVAVTSFAAPNLPDKTFSIHVTATAFAVTFTQGTLLKLTGSANLVTGANGCWISFQIKAGGVAWESGRVIY